MNEQELIKDVVAIRRRMLPWWIKLFCGIFLLLAAFLSILTLISLFTSVTFPYFGFGTSSSYHSILSTASLLFNGYVAYLLLNGKDDAIRFGKCAALLGIGVSVLAAVVEMVNEGNFILRLEILLLIGFYMWLDRNQRRWREAVL